MQNGVAHRQTRLLSQSFLHSQGFPVKNKYLFKVAARFGRVFLNVQPELPEINLICKVIP